MIEDGNSPCDEDADCNAGVCAGEGCGSGEGRCARQVEVCDGEDEAEVCDCDGVTVVTSLSCPSVRYEHEDACP